MFVFYFQLVKTKVRVFNDIQKCRVGIKIRSNPANGVPMTRLTVLMAVPPDIHGETVMMSKDGGAWDGMKRIVAWSLEPLQPGHVIEVQCQFDTAAANAKKATPRFPVLVRCDAIDEQFSDVDVCAHYADQKSSPVKINVSRSTRIMHRKV